MVVADSFEFTKRGKHRKVVVVEEGAARANAPLPAGAAAVGALPPSLIEATRRWQRLAGGAVCCITVDKA